MYDVWQKAWEAFVYKTFDKSRNKEIIESGTVEARSRDWQLRLRPSQQDQMFLPKQ